MRRETGEGVRSPFKRVTIQRRFYKGVLTLELRSALKEQLFLDSADINYNSV